jgi:Asp-tRNA(Asn)/Glu-tRNA(Gln) amidotransferase A subunit family amidase
MAANMLDLEIGFRVISNPDPAQPVSLLFPSPQPAPMPPKVKLLGIYQPWFDQAEPVVRTACRAALDYLCKSHQYEIVDITVPYLHEGQLAHALTILTEIFTGHPSTTGLTPANRILLSAAQHASARDFLLAQRLRELLMRHLTALFHQHPGLIIITPTTPLPGWHISGGAADLVHGVSDANTSTRNMQYVWLANFSGCPCLQVPVGYAVTEGGGDVPIGMMGMGEWGADEHLIAFGYDAEKWLHDGLQDGRQLPKDFVNNLTSLATG